MKSKVLLTLLFAAWAGVALAAYVDPLPAGGWFKSDEPPGAPDSVAADGSPRGDDSMCEIQDMWLGAPKDANPWQFDYRIYTNYGDGARRVTFGGGSDARTGFQMVDCPPGDLFIRVRQKPDESGTGHQTLALYGLVLETRDETKPANGPGQDGADNYLVWEQSKLDPLYGDVQRTFLSGNLYGGLVTEPGQIAQFASGTYEGYVDLDYVKDINMPKLARAEVLVAEGLIANSVGTVVDKNVFPSVLLKGANQGALGTVTWYHFPTEAGDPLDPDGTDWYPWGLWYGTVTMPNTFDPASQYVEIWWGMGCGNDAAFVNPYGEPSPFSYVPLPSSLLLCGIGAAFAGLIGRMRRQLRRSK